MLIAITGSDGAGKSEQIALLQHWLMEQGHRVRTVNKWDIFLGDKHPECRFLGPSSEEVRACFAEMEGVARPLFVFWMVAVSMPSDFSDPSCIYLLDGYWMKYLAAEMAYGGDPEWLKDVIRCFPLADLVLWLDVEPEEAVRRKKRLSPYECGRNQSATARAFLEHQHVVRGHMRDLAESLKWQRISATAPRQEVFTELCAHVEALLINRRPGPSRAGEPSVLRGQAGAPCDDGPKVATSARTRPS